jgi:hypothetical protein
MKPMRPKSDAGRTLLPAAVVCRSIAQQATTMFFGHFVSDACSRGPHKLGKQCIRP